MKPEHFIYKSDGLYYMQNVPEKPTNINYFDCSGPDGIKRHFEKGGDFGFEKYLKRYNEALERAKAEVVLVTEPYIYQKAMHSYFPHHIDYSKTPQDNFAMYATQGQVYTINMEEKIEVYDMELTSCEHCISCQLIPNCTTLAARIVEPKNEPDHECTMDLMTDVCVYSCECGKIEVASNLSYHDKPKTYIPESAPKKEEESEDEFIAYIESLKNQSFEGWNEHAVSGYTTALLSLYQKYVEIKRKPL